MAEGPGRGMGPEGRPSLARGRSRGVPPAPERKVGSPGAPVSQMEGLELGVPSVSRGGGSSGSPRSHGSHSPSDRYSDNGSNGNGNGNGNNGNGGNGERGSPPGQRGTPRGRQRRGDYVVSRPKELFSKTGSSGGKIRLLTNFFELQRRSTAGKSWRLYKYDVVIKPETDQKRKRSWLVRSQEPHLGINIFDGKNAYFSKEISADKHTVTTTDRDGTNFVLEFTLVEELNPTDPMYISFYNIMLKQIQRKLDMTEMGRNYFFAHKAIKIPQYNLELWPGFITTLQQHENSVLMCVEVTNKVLRLDNVFQVMTEIRQRATQDYQNAIKRELIGTIIMTEYNKKTYRVDDVMFEMNPMQKFTYKGQEMTISDYIREKYKITLTNNKQPLIASMPKKRDQHRGITDPFYLVPELCRMTGLNDTLRSNFQLMKSLSEHLHMEPGKRLHSVCDFVSSIMDKDEIRNDLLSWGLRFRKDPVLVEGRVIPKQNIIFAGPSPNNVQVPDDKADWTMAFRSKAMLSTVDLKRWVIMVPERDQAGLDGLLRTLNQVSRPLNFNIAQPLDRVRVQGAHPQAYTKSIQTIMNNHRGNVEMLFVILPTNKLETYAAVKKMTLVEYGIPSQCFLAKNLRAKGIMSICTKVAIQMNAKLGGEPWSVTIPLANLMVVGFDVYHASTDGRRGQAVGAMVASTSRHASQYFSTVSFHHDNEELSTNLVVDFSQCLVAYKGVNGNLPDLIMFYRDGVGQGQLAFVYEQELLQIKSVLTDTYRAAGRDPPVFSFIVISKRINTRFFEQKGQNRVDNVPPGTVVDSVVTLPERYDFFIVAQTARQGTVSPTSYNVLTDNSGLGPDKIQILSYKLCHSYYNWSGTVAVPAPVQYAHKLALLLGTAVGQNASGRLSHLLYYL